LIQFNYSVEADEFLVRSENGWVHYRGGRVSLVGASYETGVVQRVSCVNTNEHETIDFCILKNLR
jgi:hypothetical protein